MAITKNQSGTYAAVDIHYNRPACAPHQNVINYLDHLHIMVIHKSLTAYLGCGYSRVLVGPLGNDEMSDFLSVTPQNKYEIAYTMYLKKQIQQLMQIPLCWMICIASVHIRDQRK